MLTIVRDLLVLLTLSVMHVILHSLTLWATVQAGSMQYVNSIGNPSSGLSSLQSYILIHLRSPPKLIKLWISITKDIGMPLVIPIRLHVGFSDWWLV